MKSRIELTYVANPRTGLGVRRKMHALSSGARQLGFDARVTEISSSGFPAARSVAGAVWRGRSEFLLIRADYTAVAAFPALLWRRFRRTRVIFDVPGPFDAALREAFHANRSPAQRLMHVASLLALYPVVVITASTVASYAADRPILEAPIRNRLIRSRNVLDVAEMPVAARPDPAETPRMLAVGALANWHGYDRLLRGMHMAQDLQPPYSTVTLDLIGAGPELEPLQEITQALGLADRVRFLGPRQGVELDGLFDGVALGVGVLGLHRKGMRSASAIKHREYLARGVPFAMSGHDELLGVASTYIFVCPPDDSPVDIEALLRWAGPLGSSEARRGARAAAEGAVDPRQEMLRLTATRDS